MAAMVSAERRASLNGSGRASTRQPGQEDFEGDEHDHRREVKGHSTQTDRRQNRPKGAKDGFSDAEEDPADRLKRTGTRWRKPAQDNAAEQTQQKELRDVMKKDPHGGGSELFVGTVRQAGAFICRDIDAHRKDEVHARRNLLHVAAEPVAKAAGEIDKSTGEITIGVV